MCLQNVSCEMVIYIVICHEIASEYGTYITSNNFIRTNHTNCTKIEFVRHGNVLWVAMKYFILLGITLHQRWGIFFLPFNNSYFDWGGIMFIIRSFSRNANLDLHAFKHTCSMYIKYSIVYYWLFYAYRCQTTAVAPLRSKVETITQDIILRNPNLIIIFVTFWWLNDALSIDQSEDRM